MAWNDARERLVKLRELCTELAAGDGRDRIDDVIDLGGALFDENFIDGQTYSAIYDLDKSLRSGAPDVRERAETCASILTAWIR